jgi:hypothetical protein
MGHESEVLSLLAIHRACHGVAPSPARVNVMPSWLVTRAERAHS